MNSSLCDLFAGGCCQGAGGGDRRAGGENSRRAGRGARSAVPYVRGPEMALCAFHFPVKCLNCGSREMPLFSAAFAFSCMIFACCSRMSVSPSAPPQRPASVGERTESRRRRRRLRRCPGWGRVSPSEGPGASGEGQGPAAQGRRRRQWGQCAEIRCALRGSLSRSCAGLAPCFTFCAN